MADLMQLKGKEREQFIKEAKQASVSMQQEIEEKGAEAVAANI